MEIAELINIKKNIKAITIAPHILNKLSYLNNNNNFSGEVMCSGGILRKDPSDIFVGPRAINFFNGMRITISFFGVLSISLEEGWMVSSFFEAEITKAVLEKSEKVIGVCDHSKFDTLSLATIGGLELFDEIITDKDFENNSNFEKYNSQTKITLV